LFQPPGYQQESVTHNYKEEPMVFRPSNYIDHTCTYDNLERVEFVDALMGRGKTTEGIRFVEEQVRTDPQACWMLCCGPISEVEDRPKENEFMRAYWHEPDNRQGTKEQSLLKLLQDPNVRLIALTHKLWKQITTNPFVLHHISRRRFNVLFDEVPDDFAEPYTGIRLGDFQRAHQKNELAVHADQFGRVEWLDDSVAQIEDSTHLDALVRDHKRLRAFVNGKQYNVLDVPHEGGFRAFRRVIVTTYLAPGTAFTAYLDMLGIPWGPCADIVPQRKMTKAEIRSLITFETKYDKQFAEWKLDSGWYKTATSKQLNAIGKAIRNIGDRWCEGDPQRLAFTAKKKRVARTQTTAGIKAKGYTSFIHKQGKPRTDAHIDSQASCFIRCNMKASNEYRHKDVLVYAYNRHPLEPVRRFFKGYELEFDSERFALTEMLQWVWRSAVRDGKPIRLAILSARMRRLFQEWLAEEDSNVVPLPVRCSHAQPADSANDQTMDEWLANFG
jgi:hypothetical protein